MDFQKKRPKMTPGHLRVRRELAECKAKEEALGMAAAETGPKADTTTKTEGT